MILLYIVFHLALVTADHLIVHPNDGVHAVFLPVERSGHQSKGTFLSGGIVQIHNDAQIADRHG